MWILSRVNNDDKVYLLCDKQKYTVGRNKTCDIVGEQTQSSVGRFHATLHPYEDRVEIIDNDSKYGTYVNDQIQSNVKLNPNTPLALKDGDIIRFGFIDFTWTLEKANIVALTSTLNEKEKEFLKKDITSLGGLVLDEWSDTCTHLVVKNLTFTVKVLQSLCHAIPIVKPEYFKSVLSSVRNKVSHPKVESFEPPVVERLVGNNVSLQVNIDRKRLFAGKTFIFMNSRHMEKFQGIIKCGMGECSSLDKKKWQRKSLVKPGFIVINNTASSTQSQVATQAVNDLNDFLRSKECRMIPDSEISLAILHCSLEKFCNPKHTLKDNFENNLRIVPSTLLADNTPVNQPNTKGASTSSNSINVPETIEQPNSSAATATSNSNVIDLMDDDDDVILVQSLDITMETEEIHKGKRRHSANQEEPLMKKPHLDKTIELTMKSNEDDLMFRIPQRNTRSTSKNKNVATAKPTTERRLDTSIVQQDEEKPKKQNHKSTKSHINDKKIPSPLQSNPHELEEKISTEISLIEHPEDKQQSCSFNNFQSEIATSTQIQSSNRKRIAHKPMKSTFISDDSDSDDGLFKFNNEPLAKKSKPSKGNDSDSDSDDNMNYPQSSGPVAPVIITTVPSQSFTQPSQITSDSWLSRPTPSQNISNTTIRSKPKKRNDPPRTNISAGWQIGQYCISTPPISIPTQGWCSKDTIKSENFESEIKLEDVSEEKTLLEDSKWIDSIKRGIQVITKSMELISTSGKVFKKQQFIAPTEVIKTSKIYEF